MTPDQVALRYEILRTSRGSVRSLDPTSIRGERCARCATIVDHTRQRVRAQLRREIRATVRDDVPRHEVAKLVDQELRVQLPRRIEEELDREGLGYGFKTTAVKKRRRRKVGDSWIWEPPEEKDVCGACLQRTAEVYGYDQAVARTPTWKGISDKKHRGGVSISSRPDAAERRIISQMDVWNMVQPLMECVPPMQDRSTWAMGAEALILYQCTTNPQTPDEGATSSAVFAAAQDQGFQWHSPEAMDEAVKLVRAWIGRRLRTPGWQRREERFVDPRDGIKLSAAAELLNCSVDKVRKSLLPGWRSRGLAINVSPEHAKRREWLVHRDAVAEEVRRMNSASPCGSDGTLQAAALVI
ncbi:MAG: hypothetical protein ACQGVC_18180 [Myxococcota bacterium]